MFTINQLLIFAARANNLELAERRIHLGADPNYSDGNGSAAAEAVKSNSTAMLQLLVAHGLCPDRYSRDRVGLMEMAHYYQSTEAALFLLDHGFRLDRHSRPIQARWLTNALKGRGRTSNQSAHRTAG